MMSHKRSYRSRTSTSRSNETTTTTTTVDDDDVNDDGRTTDAPTCNNVNDDGTTVCFENDNGMKVCLYNECFDSLTVLGKEFVGAGKFGNVFSAKFSGEDAVVKIITAPSYSERDFLDETSNYAYTSLYDLSPTLYWYGKCKIKCITKASYVRRRHHQEERRQVFEKGGDVYVIIAGRIDTTLSDYLNSGITREQMTMVMNAIKSLYRKCNEQKFYNEDGHLNNIGLKFLGNGQMIALFIDMGMCEYGHVQYTPRYIQLITETMYAYANLELPPS